MSITRTMTLVTLHGECDQEKITEIWTSQNYRLNIPRENWGDLPKPDVIAVFRSGANTFEVRAETWKEAQELFNLHQKEITVTAG